jgi:Ca-activated chloride channel homolog
MQATRVALLAAAGMLLTSVSVYSLTPAGGLRTATGDPSGRLTAVPEQLPDPAVAGDPTLNARFVSGSTLTIEGRLGNASVPRSASPASTFVMVEVKPSDAARKAPAAVNLSLVIDRSGSMKGTRLRNAITAATTAVDRLNDGDVVDVVTFDTQVQIPVPPTTIGPGTRERVAAEIRGIQIGGDTCISCGLEAAMAQLAQTTGKVNRMIVLSDGDANHGVRDVPGFRAIAARCRDKGTSITTIGVDVDFNEKILSAIAEESNGRHYFVDNADSLARVFEAEAENLTSTVGSDAEVSIDLAPGVELERVFDRSFRRVDRRVVVPLGTFAASDVKTVLLEVRAPDDREGLVPVANVDLTYRDLATGADQHCGGKLALAVTPSGSAAPEVDPVVTGRVQRSETASVLKEANGLFEQGRLADARRKLDARERTLRTEASAAEKAASPAKAKAVSQDFEAQIAAVDNANTGFAAAPVTVAQATASPFATPPGVNAAPAAAAPPQASRAGKSAVRTNQQKAVDLAF